MNVFQKQLIVGGKPLPLLPDLEGVVRTGSYGEPPPPQKVSLADFEAEVAAARERARVTAKSD